MAAENRELSEWKQQRLKIDTTADLKRRIIRWKKLDAHLGKQQGVKQNG